MKEFKTIGGENMKKKTNDDVEVQLPFMRRVESCMFNLLMITAMHWLINEVFRDN